MAEWLKQSAAVTVKIGPFVDDTDGKTAETALTISQSDVRLSKNGGAFAQKNDANAATHDENGYYAVALNATDTNTLGRLKLTVSESGALPVWETYMVVPAMVYESLVGGTDALQVETNSYAAGAFTAAAFATGAITASTFAAGSLTSAGIAPDAIDASAFAADAVAEIVAGILAGAVTAPTAAPTAPYTVDDVLGWLLAVSKFRRGQTATLETIYQDNSSTSLATSVKADNGTTFSRYEYE